MAAAAPGLPQQNRETIVDDLAGMGNFFIDPQGAARRIFSKWFWVGPMIVVSIISIVVQWEMIPLVRHVLEVGPTPANSTPEQAQRGIQMGLTIQRISMYVTPLLVLAMTAIQAALVLGSCSVLSIRAKFLDLFNLVAGCSLISALGAIAMLIVIKAKGEPSSMAEMRPPLGLDIFLPEGANKYLLAILGYFSIFQVWMIVIFILTLSVAFRVKKGTAFAAFLPVMLLGILLSVVGAVFRRS